MRAPDSTFCEFLKKSPLFAPAAAIVHNSAGRSDAMRLENKVAVVTGGAA